MASLLPLLNIVLGQASAANDVSRAVESLFHYMHLPPTAGAILAVIVGFVTIKSLFLQLAMTHASYTANRVAADLRVELLRALMSARWSYFVKQRAGNLTAALNSEPTRASQCYLSLCNMLVALVQGLAYTVVAATISLPITFAALGIGALSALLLNRFVRISSKAGSANTKIQKQFLSLLADSIAAMKPIKATASEDRVLPLLERQVEDYNRAQNRGAVTTQAVKNLQEPIRVAALAVGFLLLTAFWTNSTGALILLSFLFLRTVERLGLVQRFLQQTLNNQPAFWFIRSVIDQVRRVRERHSGGALPTLMREIAVQHLSFAYGKDRILQNLTMTIPVNAIVSLVGRSGSGKSTFADLLTGLQVAQAGEIHVDGVSLSDLDIRAWRQMLGYVPQETILFHDTVLANVTLGDSDVSQDAAEVALRRAEAWDFVATLPEGLDTVVGERGSRLSGGQRQRIALARALVRNPKLLILDEATSALDPETERSICRTLKRLSRDLTILAISHNRALVDIADFVYELQDGKLVAFETASAASPSAISTRPQ